MVGATAGAVPPVADYFRRIREICDRYGVLLILDEVMCGMGRTGTLHACEQDGVAPDLMTIAKGLGGGYQPIGAVLLAPADLRRLRRTAPASSSTATPICAIPMACAAALAVQEVIARDGLLDNVKAMGAHLARRLGERFGNHAHVGDIRGRGLFMGVELVEDRSTKAPFDPKLQAASRAIKREAMARGLMVYPDGRHDRRRARRPRAACAALHRRRGGNRHDRRTAWRRRSTRRSPKHKINPAYMRRTPSTPLRSA